MLTPICDELADEYKQASFFKVNVDNDGGLSQQYNIMSVPTILIFKDGAIVETITGFVPKEVFVDQINKFA